MRIVFWHRVFGPFGWIHKMKSNLMEEAGIYTLSGQKKYEQAL